MSFDHHDLSCDDDERLWQVVLPHRLLSPGPATQQRPDVHHEAVRVRAPGTQDLLISLIFSLHEARLLAGRRHRSIKRPDCCSRPWQNAEGGRVPCLWIRIRRDPSLATTGPPATARGFSGAWQPTDQHVRVRVYHEHTAEWRIPSFHFMAWPRCWGAVSAGCRKLQDALDLNRCWTFRNSHFCQCKAPVNAAGPGYAAQGHVVSTACDQTLQFPAFCHVSSLFLGSGMPPGTPQRIT